MYLLNLGRPSKSFDAAAASAATGTAFALPNVATQITWVTSFGSAPSAVSIALQTSLDNSIWTTIDTSTATAGASRNINTSALFVRAVISSITDGTEITVTIIGKQYAIVTGVAGLNGQVQFNDGGSFGGDSGLTFDKSTNFLSFLAAGGMSFGATVHPITFAGGDDGFGESALIINNSDDYIPVLWKQPTDFILSSSFAMYAVDGQRAAIEFTSGSNGTLAGTIKFQVPDTDDFRGSIVQLGSIAGESSAVTIAAGGVIFMSFGINANTALFDDLVTLSVPLDATGYKVSGVDGISTTVTTASLIGKTITVTNGLITGFA